MAARTFLKKATACSMAALVAGSLSIPATALAVVRVDEAELAQGANAVGGGTATLDEKSLDMVDVTANELYTDESLDVNFNGGNDIEQVTVDGSATVELSFSGENEVEEVAAGGNSDVTVNANGHNEFEEISARDNSNVTINVTGENDFEEIEARDDASITMRGTDCQKKDIANIGEDENDTALSTERGNLTIDHVTVNLKGKEAIVGSTGGDVRIDTSKVAKDDGNEYALITAGGTMEIRESVVDIMGTLRSTGAMTIDHSDVTVASPADTYAAKDGPYRVYSETGVELIREKNGEVLKGSLGTAEVAYVDTGDGKDVKLKADGKPGYYACKDDDEHSDASAPTKSMPKTDDAGGPLGAVALALAGAAAAGIAAKRRKETA